MLRRSLHATPLSHGWDLQVTDLEYAPVGFGAHHWRATTRDGQKLLLSLHELDLVGRFGNERVANLQALSRALETAHWL